MAFRRSGVRIPSAPPISPLRISTAYSFEMPFRCAAFFCAAFVATLTEVACSQGRSSGSLAGVIEICQVVSPLTWRVGEVRPAGTATLLEGVPTLWGCPSIGDASIRVVCIGGQPRLVLGRDLTHAGHDDTNT